MLKYSCAGKQKITYPKDTDIQKFASKDIPNNVIVSSPFRQ
jgi:hypothetical protein